VNTTHLKFVLDQTVMRNVKRGFSVCVFTINNVCMISDGKHSHYPHTQRAVATSVVTAARQQQCHRDALFRRVYQIHANVSCWESRVDCFLAHAVASSDFTVL
jgi:hypothetical protein